MITYDDISHTYFLDGVQIQNVTTWIEKFVPEFPKELIASKVALKQDRTMLDVLAEWEIKGKISCDYGNYIHKTIEAHIKWGVEGSSDVQKAVIADFKKKTGTFSQLYPEIVVHGQINNEELAGTVDLIAKDKSGKLKIIDYKTNKDLHKKNGKLLVPYEDLGNTPLNKYRLQLNTYRTLLGKDCKMEVWWWNNEKQEFEITKIDKIKI